MLTVLLVSLQTHQKDAEFLNKSIQNYKEMSQIFGNGQATRKFAMGSNETLGSPSDFAESSLKAEILDEGKSPKSGLDMDKVFADGLKGSKQCLEEVNMRI